LRINETVYNKNSPITLLSEYQMREHGIVVDSVASKHFTAKGTPDTQTLYASDVVRCPLLDRGGLMGITLYPVEDGDEEKYEIFDLTSDQTWIPRSFMNESLAYNVNTPTTLKTLFHNIPVVSDSMSFYDPTDNDMVSIGTSVKLQITPFVEALTFTQLTGTAGVGSTMTHNPCDQPESTALATKAWHRVIHKDLDPVLLQP
jgi:hypothetical protein